MISSVDNENDKNPDKHQLTAVNTMITNQFTWTANTIAELYKAR